ncbi:MAG TPA: hypothetical protein VMW01_16395 [Williamwhitmania sp.]|nr:hypothetical protein [Williamwhitmania sp.]
MKNSKSILSFLFSALIFGVFMLLGSNPAEASGVTACATFGVGAIEWPDGEENMGGLDNIIHFIPISWIGTEAKLVDNPTTDEEKCVITDTHTLAATKYWREVYCTEGTVKLTPENQGDIDSSSFRPKGEFTHPGNKTQAIAFSRDVNNTPCIVLFHDNGVRFQVGTVARPARIKPSWDSGAKGSDHKGFKFAVEADSKVILTEYRGAIALSETETLPAVS